MERLEIEDRGSRCIEQELAIFSRNLDRDNQQAIAAFDRNFMLLIVGLGAGRSQEAGNEKSQDSDKRGWLHGFPIPDRSSIR